MCKGFCVAGCDRRSEGFVFMPEALGRFSKTAFMPARPRPKFAKELRRMKMD
jgi:hypothetical protein